MGGVDSCPGPGRAPGVLPGDLRRGTGGGGAAGARGGRRGRGVAARAVGAGGAAPSLGGREGVGRLAVRPRARAVRGQARGPGNAGECGSVGLAGDLRARLGIW